MFKARNTLLEILVIIYSTQLLMPQLNAEQKTFYFMVIMFYIIKLIKWALKD